MTPARTQPRRSRSSSRLRCSSNRWVRCAKPCAVSVTLKRFSRRSTLNTSRSRRTPSTRSESTSRSVRSYAIFSVGVGLRALRPVPLPHPFPSVPSFGQASSRAQNPRFPAPSDGIDRDGRSLPARHGPVRDPVIGESESASVKPGVALPSEARRSSREADVRLARRPARRRDRGLSVPCVHAFQDRSRIPRIPPASTSLSIFA